MHSLILDGGAGKGILEKKSGSNLERLRRFRELGLQVAKSLRKIAKGSGDKRVNLESILPLLRTIKEDDIDGDTTLNIGQLVRLKCMLLLVHLGPEELVGKAIDERWVHILESLESMTSLGTEISKPSEPIDPRFREIMEQIATRILSQANPIKHHLQIPSLLPSSS